METEEKCQEEISDRGLEERNVSVLRGAAGSRGTRKRNGDIAFSDSFPFFSFEHSPKSKCVFRMANKRKLHL